MAALQSDGFAAQRPHEVPHAGATRAHVVPAIPVRHFRISLQHMPWRHPGSGRECVCQPCRSGCCLPALKHRRPAITDSDVSELTEGDGHMPVTYRARNDVCVTDGKERPDHPHEEYGSTDASSKLLDWDWTHLKKDTKPTARSRYQKPCPKKPMPDLKTRLPHWRKSRGKSSLL